MGPLARMSFADLPRRIDYVVITHSHPDHLDIETLLRLRHRVGTLMVPRASGALAGDYSPRLLGKALGFKNVLEPYFYESLPIPDGEIIAAPFMGEHGDVAHAKTAWIVRTARSGCSSPPIPCAWTRRRTATCAARWRSRTRSS